MKNKFTVLTVLLLLLTISFGCSFIDKAKSVGSSDNSSTSNQSNSSNPSNSANPNDTAKTGIAECDEFIDLINNDSKKDDEDFVTRKIREYAIDFAKETIKKNLEENKGDKEKIAQKCKEGKEDYIKKKENKNKENQKDSEKNDNTQKS